MRNIQTVQPAISYFPQISTCTVYTCTFWTALLTYSEYWRCQYPDVLNVSSRWYFHRDATMNFSWARTRVRAIITGATCTTAVAAKFSDILTLFRDVARSENLGGASCNVGVKILGSNLPPPLLSFQHPCYSDQGDNSVKHRRGPTKTFHIDRRPFAVVTSHRVPVSDFQTFRRPWILWRRRCFCNQQIWIKPHFRRSYVPT